MRFLSERFNTSPEGIRCLIGGFILCLSFASDFSYPNLNSYLTSYMRINGYNPNLTYADFVFLSTTKTVIQGLSMPFIGTIARRIGVKSSIALGVVIYSVGFILTYFTVQYLFVFAVLTLSCHGIAFSFVYATAIGTAQSWFPPQRKGLVGSIVISGYGFGSLFWVPIQTAFVNPYNVKAVIDPFCAHIGTEHEQSKCDVYFSDSQVLNQVPYMFLLLGFIFLLMGIIAIFLINEQPQKKSNIESTEIKKDSVSDSLRPQQVLKTTMFYQIWIGFFSVTMANGLMGNYSKTFGMSFINDDHFYAKVAVFLNILNGCCRIVWGLNYDRFGFKVCFMLIGATVTFITSCLPLLPLIGNNTLAVKLCYATCMCLLYSTFPGIYAVVAAAVNDAFGPRYYQANFGLLFTTAVAYCLVIICLTKVPPVYSLLGYTGMFLIGGLFGAIGLLAVAFSQKDLKQKTEEYSSV